MEKTMPYNHLFVTGVSQSKTSYITCILHNLGWISYFKENSPQYHGRNFYFVYEEKEVYSLNDKYFWWAEPDPLNKKIIVSEEDKKKISEIREEFNKHERWVIKDPRLIGMLPFWYKEGSGVIIVFRHPYYIFKYREKFSTYFKWPDFINFWSNSYTRVLNTLVSNKIPYIAINPGKNTEEALGKLGKFVGISSIPKLPIDIDLPLKNIPGAINKSGRVEGIPISDLEKVTNKMWEKLLKHETA